MRVGPSFFSTLPRAFARGMLALFLLSTGGVVACRHKPAVSSKKLPSAVVSQEKEVLAPELIKEALGEADESAYKVGSGDTLLVAVYGHPELSLAPYVGSSVALAGNRSAGLVVDNDGTIQFPLVGSVPVKGKTAEELRVFLEQELSTYVVEPKVTVQVIFNGSIRYYLLGQFTDPGLKFSDRPLHLLEGLSLGGSVQLEGASLRSAYVARNGKRLPVNFRRLIREGDLGQNLRLQSGDVVVVPDSGADQAFVFGGSPGSNPQGGSVPFQNGRLTLLQALAQAGFGIRERVQLRMSEIRVIRSEGAEGELFVINARKILSGDAAPFALEPGDIVFVPMTAFTGWNQVIEQFLPTLQVVSGVLQPFVQIRFLSQ